LVYIDVHVSLMYISAVPLRYELYHQLVWLD